MREILATEVSVPHVPDRECHGSISAVKFPLPNPRRRDPMSKLASIARRIVRNEEGATMVEYALMIALIAVVVIAGATLLGNSVNAKFGTVATNVGTAS